MALIRLGAKPRSTKADLAYMSGRSTQVPTGRLIGIDKRINRKISYKDAVIHYEISNSR